jgi:hypothetical protein
VPVAVEALVASFCAAACAADVDDAVVFAPTFAEAWVAPFVAAVEEPADCDAAVASTFAAAEAVVVASL